MRILDPRHLTFSVSSRFTTYCRSRSGVVRSRTAGSGVGKPRRPSRFARSPGRAWVLRSPTEVDGEGLARGHGDRNARTPDGSRSRGGHPVAAGSRLGWRGGAASRPATGRTPMPRRGFEVEMPRGLYDRLADRDEALRSPLRHGDGAGGACRRAEYRPRAAGGGDLGALHPRQARAPRRGTSWGCRRRGGEPASLRFDKLGH